MYCGAGPESYQEQGREDRRPEEDCVNRDPAFRIPGEPFGPALAAAPPNITHRELPPDRSLTPRSLYYLSGVPERGRYPASYLELEDSMIRSRSAPESMALRAQPVQVACRFSGWSLR